MKAWNPLEPRHGTTAWSRFPGLSLGWTGATAARVTGEPAVRHKRYRNHQTGQETRNPGLRDAGTTPPDRMHHPAPATGSVTCWDASVTCWLRVRWSGMLAANTSKMTQTNKNTQTNKKPNKKTGSAHPGCEGSPCRLRLLGPVSWHSMPSSLTPPGLSLF